MASFCGSRLLVLSLVGSLAVFPGGCGCVPWRKRIDSLGRDSVWNADMNVAWSVVFVGLFFLCCSSRSTCGPSWLVGKKCLAPSLVTELRFDWGVVASEDRPLHGPDLGEECETHVDKPVVRIFGFIVILCFFGLLSDAQHISTAHVDSGRTYELLT